MLWYISGYTAAVTHLMVLERRHCVKHWLVATDLSKICEDAIFIKQSRSVHTCLRTAHRTRPRTGVSLHASRLLSGSARAEAVKIGSFT